MTLRAGKRSCRGLCWAMLLPLLSGGCVSLLGCSTHGRRERQRQTGRHEMPHRRGSNDQGGTSASDRHTTPLSGRRDRAPRTCYA